jgi:sulfate permease, SulP family
LHGLYPYDLEGELFFGAEPELDRHLSGLGLRAGTQGIRYIVLRLKRVRNPDVVCLERLEHFLRDAEKLGITVFLAGVRFDFLESVKRLRFSDWYPADRIFPEQDDKDSATLAAVRRVYELLGQTNSCPHCAVPGKTEDAKERLYYLV